MLYLKPSRLIIEINHFYHYYHHHHQHHHHHHHHQHHIKSEIYSGSILDYARKVNDVKYAYAINTLPEANLSSDGNVIPYEHVPADIVTSANEIFASIKVREFN